MRVLKIVAEGITTSFRYPHFMQGIHPTFEMPPPATIYGHISSALGEWFDPAGVRFAYHFTHQGSAVDMEHIILASPAGGYLPDTKIPKVLEGNVNPFERHLLFRPRLTLYLNRPEWAAAFRSPRYAVALGRSQDLCSYISVQVIELEQAERAYFEHTLLPHRMALLAGRGVAVLMPRYLDYAQDRRPCFAQYLMLQERVHLPRTDGIRFDGLTAASFWIDPTTPSIKGDHLGLAFHRFVGDENDACGLA